MAGTVPNDLPLRIRIAGRAYVPGADLGVAVLLTAAGWVLQRLPRAKPSSISATS